MLLYLQDLVSVPALSECTIRRDIEASDFTTGLEVQVLTSEISVNFILSCNNTVHDNTRVLLH